MKPVHGCKCQINLHYHCQPLGLNALIFQKIIKYLLYYIFKEVKEKHFSVIKSFHVVNVVPMFTLFFYLCLIFVCLSVFWHVVFLRPYRYCLSQCLCWYSTLISVFYQLTLLIYSIIKFLHTYLCKSDFTKIKQNTATTKIELICLFSTKIKLLKCVCKHS